MVKEKPEDKYNAKGIMNAVNCFKDVGVTATFGKFGSGYKN